VVVALVEQGRQILVLVAAARVVFRRPRGFPLAPVLLLLSPLALAVQAGFKAKKAQADRTLFFQPLLLLEAAVVALLELRLA
jgi:hypothetical protein